MDKLRKLVRKPGVLSFLSSVTAIIMGLILGYFLLRIFNPAKASDGFVKLITTGFSAPDKFGRLLYVAAPILMTGLSVGFAFKTGLFNIGASGQYLIGALFALIGALVFKWPWWACLLLSMLGGAIWGVFPGIFKAFFNVNEVITSIMFNWIGLFTMNLVISNIPQMLANYYGANVNNRTPLLGHANTSAILPAAGLNELLGTIFANIGFFLALGFAVIIYFVLEKTVFGYEMKACGFNKNASVYAGINAKRNIVLSMVIAGALSGAAGGIYYLSGISQYVIEKILPSAGFNGIPVALLASSNPLGIIFSALFIAYVQVGGDMLQPEYVKETIDIIIAAIIYLSAFSLLMRDIIRRLFEGRKAKREGVPPPDIPPAEPEAGALAETVDSTGGDAETGKEANENGGHG